MLNTSLKKEAFRKLDKEIKEYKDIADETVVSAEKLHETRTSAAIVIESIEKYVNNLANTPKSFEREFNEIMLNITSFKVLSEIQYDEQMMIKIVGGGTATGVATGVATAAFAPSAAMAIATTFGTASTGAAISGLSGAAATNAALAWLGGGALAAGGGGMAGGSFLLALAGPIGLGIGAVALVGGGALANMKNKEAAIKADAERLKLAAEKAKYSVINKEIIELESITRRVANELYKMFYQLLKSSKQINSYNDFSRSKKNTLIAIINNTHSLSTLFLKEIG